MSEFILQIEQLIRAAGDPEYRYLLLEPLIFYGIFIGIAMLITGHFTKAPKLQTTALVVIGIAALTHVPYKDARLAAQPRMEKVYKVKYPARVKGFNENTQQWIANSWKFKLLVLAALATLMIGIDRNKFGFGMAVATCVLGLVSAKNAMWLNYQDAIAYHPNLTVHEAPIDKTKKIASSNPPPSPPTTPNRSATRAPLPAATHPVAPSSPVQQLSAQSQSGRIPPPQVPGPRERSFQPLPKYR